MKYLLDTNICIYVIKQRPAQVKARFAQVPLGDLGISSITLAELQYGVEKSQLPAKSRQALQQFVAALEIYDFDDSATQHYGRIRTYLEQKGTPIGSLDTLIAAHALSLKATLVTNNVKEFQRVPGLTIENWL